MLLDRIKINDRLRWKEKRKEDYIDAGVVVVGFTDEGSVTVRIEQLISRPFAVSLSVGQVIPVNPDDLSRTSEQANEIKTLNVVPPPYEMFVPTPFTRLDWTISDKQRDNAYPPPDTTRTEP